MTSDVLPDAGPVVVSANWYRFRGSERISHPHVMSASFIWIVRGRGTIRSAGRTFRMTANSAVRLPWRHAVDYDADQRDPFHIGTIHVVPRHSSSVPVVPGVAHLPGDPMLNDPARSGDIDEFPVGVATFEVGAARRIAELGQFAVQRFTEQAYDEEVFRSLGRLVMLENQGWRHGESDDVRTPAPYEEMVAFVRANLGRPLGVEDVARAGACSATTAQRLFNRHAGSSIQVWVRHARLAQAAVLLRSTGMRVGEVAALVGFSDPLHFSRAFRRAHGVAPSRYAAGVLRP